MNQASEMETRLWEYIDGISQADEKSVIEKLIAEQETWRKKYSELLEIHQLLAQTELEQPSMRFTRNVMEEIAKHHIAPATKQYINKKIIWGIASFFILLVIGFLLYGFNQINWAEGADPNSNFGINFEKVNYSKMFSNTFVNLFMMLNVVLGLMLFDRYLENRKRMFKKNLEGV
jgi:hypothetical protein